MICARRAARSDGAGPASRGRLRRGRLGRWLLIGGGAGLVRDPDPGARRWPWSGRSSSGGLAPFLAALAAPEVAAGVRPCRWGSRPGDGGQHGLRRRLRAGAGPPAVLGPGAGRRPGRPAVRHLADRRRADAGRPLRPGRLARAAGSSRTGSGSSTRCPGMVLATMFVTVPFVVRELVPGAPRARATIRAGRLHPGRRPLADLLERHAAVDPLGPGLRRHADGRPVAGRVRRGARGLGQRHRPDPDGHPLHPRRDRELPPRGGLRRQPGAGRRLVRPADRDGRRSASISNGGREKRS